MHIHSPEKIAQLIELRKRGYSINELVRELSMPKTTIWHHIHYVTIPAKYRAVLKSKRGGNLARKKKAWETANQEARAIIGGYHKYETAILAMLYWAEGNAKRECIFTNTNPEMIKCYVNILKKCFNINSDKLSVTIRYFTGMDSRKCLNHWSRVVGFPKKEIKMYYNDGGRRGRSPFGICRIAVRRGSHLFKVIQCLIKYITDEITAPVVQRIRTIPS